VPGGLLDGGRALARGGTGAVDHARAWTAFLRRTMCSLPGHLLAASLFYIVASARRWASFPGADRAVRDVPHLRVRLALIVLVALVSTLVIHTLSTSCCACRCPGAC
jgi:hypothetical protein